MTLDEVEGVIRRELTAVVSAVFRTGAIDTARLNQATDAILHAASAHASATAKLLTADGRWVIGQWQKAQQQAGDATTPTQQIMAAERRRVLEQET